MICDRCGAELRVGDWPYCKGDPEKHVPLAAAAVVDDQLDGGARWFEHLDHEPVWIDSKSQLKAELDKRGLRMTEKWAGESDRHLTNWAAAIDPYTLESARTLLTRGSRRDAPAPIHCETMTFSIRDVKLSEYAE